MLKRMLGIDPAEIKSHIEELANAASGMHSEQKRIAEFQNLLANNALKQNEQLARIIHDVANVSQGLMAIAKIFTRPRTEETIRHLGLIDFPKETPFCGEGVQNQPKTVVVKSRPPIEDFDEHYPENTDDD